MQADTPFDYSSVAVDCTATAMTACAAMTAMSFDCWRQSLEVWSPARPTERSWYRKPAFASPAIPAMPMASLPAFMAPPSWYGANPWSSLYAGASPASWASAWLDMFPLRGPPASWPFAFAMIASGVPRSVALPTAEANVAVMETAEVMSRPMRSAFASYHGGGGHAVSILSAPPSLLLAALALQMSGASWPWLPAPPASLGFF